MLDSRQVYEQLPFEGQIERTLYQFIYLICGREQGHPRQKSQESIRKKGMEEFLSFNQHGPFDFSFGCFNSAAIQDMRSHFICSFTLIFQSLKDQFVSTMCYQHMQVDILACTILQTCRNEMEVNKKKAIFHFYFFWNGLVGCST